MHKTKKHIVLLTSEFPPLPGGIGNHAYNLSEQLSQIGYDVSVIADQRDTKESEDKFDGTLKSTIYRVSLRSSRLLMYLKRIWLCFKLSKSADVLLCSGKFPLWVGAVLKNVISAQTIAIIHGTEVNFKNKQLRKSIDASLTKFDKIIAVSNFTKTLIDYLNLKNITVIPNGFAINALKNHKSEVLSLKGNPKLLTVGHVSERKGQLNVIKHLPKLIEAYSDIHYHCVGFKTEVRECIAVAKALNVLEYVTFHGHVSHEELKGFYNNSDIFVMLSKTTDTGDVEGFGIALIEANHFGLPTIGAKGCGIEDAIAHGKSGILVNGHDATEFCEAITTILDNKLIFQEESILWSEQHKWEYIINRYVDCIEE